MATVAIIKGVFATSGVNEGEHASLSLNSFKQGKNTLDILVIPVIFWVLAVIVVSAICSHKICGEESATVAFYRYFWLGLFCSPAAILISYCTSANSRDFK
ncbi:hypothetical protein [Klebsiella quasivariicola]|uniref:hypothetical protein n=1 Tax=Klebsiella quasivariicola TaxID=2026240 RepID=UPI0024792B7E|nr:hypothetical protein [Klebsiella quasivariicola]